jgi:hypothetical protein
VECCPALLQRLCEVTGYWRELEPTVIHVDTEHPKHAQCVTCLVSMQATEQLGHIQLQLPGVCTDPCDMGLCIFMLKLQVIAGNERHDNGPQDLVTVSPVHSN